ncbi:hypothetical protein Tco_0370301, partial [Tanacetum coccineum]
MVPYSKKPNTRIQSLGLRPFEEDDPNITMAEYIRLEKEKAHRCGKVYNWETTTYGKIWDNEDVHDLGSVETEFPAIVFNDTLTSKATLSCEPMVISLNDNEIDFRISFDEFDDDDYTPMISCFNDLDYFKDFENDFLAIIYNALTSKSDSSTELVVIPQHIYEFNLKDETSLSECDEEEQNILNFNDLFPFNIIYFNDSKSDKDNDDDKVDIEQSLGDLSVKPLLDVINTNVVYTAYSLNEYSVYDTGINMAYPKVVGDYLIKLWEWMKRGEEWSTHQAYGLVITYLNQRGRKKFDL